MRRVSVSSKQVSQARQDHGGTVQNFGVCLDESIRGENARMGRQDLHLQDLNKSGSGARVTVY